MFHILEWILFSIFIYQVLCSFLIMVSVMFVLPALLYKMYTSHRLVFNSHWVGLVLQGGALVSTAIVIGAKNYVGASTLLCVITEGLEFLAYNWLLVGRHHKENLCINLFERFIDFNSSETGLITQLLIELATILLPITVYLLTHKPHDCFRCLGKDPNICTYSIFQQAFNTIEEFKTVSVMDQLQTSLFTNSVLYD